MIKEKNSACIIGLSLLWKENIGYQKYLKKTQNYMSFLLFARRIYIFKRDLTTELVKQWVFFSYCVKVIITYHLIQVPHYKVRVYLRLIQCI